MRQSRNKSKNRIRNRAHKVIWKRKIMSYGKNKWRIRLKSKRKLDKNNWKNQSRGEQKA